MTTCLPPSKQRWSRCPIRPRRISRSRTGAKENAEPPSLSADDLQAFPHLGLTGAGLPKDVSRGTVRKYARGEQVVKEGQRLSGLHPIVRGRVALSARNATGAEVEIARLELLVLESESAYALIEQTPRLSRQIGGVMEARRKALQKTRTGNGSSQA